VPLWLALTLKRQKKCRVVLPDWLDDGQSVMLRFACFRCVGIGPPPPYVRVARASCVLRTQINTERLAEALRDERRNEGVFQPLPFHYVEIAHLLLQGWVGQ